MAHNVQNDAFPGRARGRSKGRKFFHSYLGRDTDTDDPVKTAT